MDGGKVRSLTNVPRANCVRRKSDGSRHSNRRLLCKDFFFARFEEPTPTRSVSEGLGSSLADASGWCRSTADGGSHDEHSPFVTLSLCHLVTLSHERRANCEK